MAVILVVDDERLLRVKLQRALESEGHDVRTAETGATGLAAARDEPPDLVLLDLRLPDRSGLDVLSELRAHDPGLPVVLMTAYGSIRDAVEAMRRGASDYLQKPLDVDELSLLVPRILDERRRARELAYLRERERGLPEGIVGSDPALRAIFAQGERLRRSGLAPEKRPTVLLTGETGAGKGVVARGLHDLLGGGPFIEVNCSAIPPTLVEAELFGHERGTFTDARESRPGLVEAAEGGTLFLDEIGDLSAELQAKFLKVIEERRVRRLGSTRDRGVNAHVIAATHRDLDRAVEEGSFRRDLLHRLRVLSFEVPPLRARPDDIALLARHFANELGQQYDSAPRGLTAEALELLRSYPWPGNVRELRNVLERAILLEREDPLGAEVLFRVLGAAPGAPESAPRSVSPGGRAPALPLPAEGVDLQQLERAWIEQALERTGGNRTRAAALLGLSRDTLRYRLEKHGLS